MRSRSLDPWAGWPPPAVQPGWGWAGRPPRPGGGLALVVVLALVVGVFGPAGTAAMLRDARQAVARARQHAARSPAQPERSAGPGRPGAAARRAVAYARAQLGKPYRWGGTGPGAFDCSGLTRAAWAAAGVALPRTAAEQFHAGARVARDRLAPGDLVFYASDGPSGWHVALATGRGRMIEAPGQGERIRQVPVRSGRWRGAVRPHGGDRR